MSESVSQPEDGGKNRALILEGRFDKRPLPPVVRWRPCHRRTSIPTAIVDVCDFGWNRLLFWSWKWASLGPDHSIC